MSLEALFVLLFTVFAVPGACFLILLFQFCRGLWLGYSTHRRLERNRPVWRV